MTFVSVPLVAASVLLLAVALTRLWLKDTSSRALRQLYLLGMQPGRTYKLGGSWALVAVRDGRNLLLAILAVAAWIAVAVSIHAAHL